jgi:hypothetical protein
MAGRPGSDGIEIAAVADVDAPRRQRGRRPWLQVAAAVAVVAVVVATAVIVADDDGTSADGPKRSTKVVTDPVAQRTVAAALGASTGTGGYEVAYDFVIDPPEGDVGRDECTDSARESVGRLERAADALRSGTQHVIVACGGTARPRVTVSGHGTVHLDPYLLETTSTVSGLGEVSVKTDGTQIVEQGGGNYGSLENGQPLSGFASLVQGTFGDGPGALTMLGLASPTGYLSLSADAVTGVTAVGAGVVDGAPVTYYDVVSDTAAMERLAGLTDEQQKTIRAALEVLDRSGFEEARARIAIDAAGYIRESTSTATFSDGTRMTRHMTLSRFGCIGAGPTPVNPTGEPANLPPECTATTTTVPPAAVEVPTSTTTRPLTSTTTDTAPPDQTATTTLVGPDPRPTPPSSNAPSG